MIIKMKDEDIQKLQVAGGMEFANSGNALVPASVQQELNTLQALKSQQISKINSLKEEVKYLKKVSRD